VPVSKRGATGPIATARAGISPTEVIPEAVVAAVPSPCGTSGPSVGRNSPKWLANMLTSAATTFPLLVASPGSTLNRNWKSPPGVPSPETVDTPSCHSPSSGISSVPVTVPGRLTSN